MLVFPQLLSGAVAQFPVIKQYSVRNVSNLQEDGSRYQFDSGDPAEITWMLTYEHMSQLEADILSAFFLTTSGRLTSFTFLDPTGNLLLWSEDLSKPIWEKSPLLTILPSEQNGFTVAKLASPAAGTITLEQSLPCPASATVCFGVYARSDQAVTLKLSAATVEQSFALSTVWKQYFVTRAGNGSGETTTVRLSLDGGQAEIERLTLSAQPSPAGYTVTGGSGGVMPRTRFDQDSLSLTAVGKDDLSCDVRLTSQLT